MKYFQVPQLALLVVMLTFVISCENEGSPDASFQENDEVKTYGLQKRTETVDSKYFRDLDDLAKLLAIRQDDLRECVIRGLKKSDIREGIIDLSRAVRDNSSQPFSRDAVSRIDNFHGEHIRQSPGRPNLKKLLATLSRDINIYFPVKEHRKNVLEEGQDYWVAFNPPLHDETEYFVTAHGKDGQTKTLSSKSVPRENVLVVAYSENQEKYTAQLLPCGDEDCGGGGGGGGGGGTTTYYEGLRLVSVRTDNITDGWLDGDLELRIKVHQGAFTFSHPLGTSTISAYTYLNVFKNHDAGSWGIFGWDDSNKWTTINAYRKWSERLSVTVNGVTYYNPIFLVEVKEEDPVFNDDIGEASFSSDTFAWGSALYVVDGSKKCRVVIDKGLYPSTVY